MWNLVRWGLCQLIVVMWEIRILSKVASERISTWTNLFVDGVWFSLLSWDRGALSFIPCSSSFPIRLVSPFSLPLQGTWILQWLVVFSFSHLLLSILPSYFPFSFPGVSICQWTEACCLWRIDCMLMCV